ncbi:putative ABC transporter [Ixodes scapularis]
MLLEGMVLFCFLGWMDSGHGRTAMTGEGEADARTMDQDVELEKEKVEDLQARQAFSEHALVVRNLHKWHEKRHVVRGLYLALPPRECFGLLGVRGAGKTTTLEMIAGLVPMSTGEAYMQAVELPRNQRKWQASVGFCPESGGLLDGLSPYDALRLFAGLRGVPGHRAQELVQSLLSFLELRQDAHRPTGLIRRLASFCDYGEALESRAAEMFISGIHSTEMQDRLVRESDGANAPSLDRAVQLAQQFEWASRDCDLFRRLSDQSPNASHVVGRVQDGRDLQPLSDQPAQDGEA